MRFKPLFCNNSAIPDFCTGDDKGIGNRHSLQPLLFADQALKMGYLKNLCDKSLLIPIRQGKNLLVLFCPRQHIRTDILSFEFGPDFSG